MIAVAARLTNAVLPMVDLPATDGTTVTLGALPGTSVLYIFPRTSPPDGTSIPGWGEIPGAKGCTPQSCGFRDHFAELRAAGAHSVFGLSTQTSAYQAEAAARLHLPFPLLSDAEGAFRRALDLPVFEAGGMTLLVRMAMVLRDGVIVRVFHPVDDPAGNAQAVLDALLADQPTV